MSDESREDRGLQLEEDLNFQRREWRAERVGWAAMFIIVLAAVAGACGVGPLSWRTDSSANGAFHVAYSGFLRIGHSTTTEIVVANPAKGSGMIRLTLPAAYVDAFTIDAIEPQPHSVTTAEDGFVYAFAVDAGSELRVHFAMTPNEPGVAEGQMTLDGVGTVRMRQFVYP